MTSQIVRAILWYIFKFYLVSTNTSTICKILNIKTQSGPHIHTDLIMYSTYANGYLLSGHCVYWYHSTSHTSHTTSNIVLREPEDWWTTWSPLVNTPSVADDGLCQQAEQEEISSSHDPKPLWHPKAPIYQLELGTCAAPSLPHPVLCVVKDVHTASPAVAVSSSLHSPVHPPGHSENDELAPRPEVQSSTSATN